MIERDRPAHAPTMIPPRARVHALLLAAMMSWGLNLTAVKLLTQVMDISVLAVLRMALAAAFLVGLLRWQKPQARPWTGREFVAGLALGALMVYVQQMLFTTGMAQTSATNAALVIARGPFVSLVVEALTLRSGLRLRQLAGVALALAGVATVVLHRPGAHLTDVARGDLIIFVAQITWAVGGVMVQRLARSHSMLSISTFTHVAGAAMLLAHSLLAAPGPAATLAAVAALPAWGWGLLAFSGLVATALGMLAWARGIAELGIGVTASYLSWVPVFGVAFGALFLREPVTPWHLVGMVGVLGGSVLALRGARPARAAPPAAD